MNPRSKENQPVVSRIVKKVEKLMQLENGDIVNGQSSPEEIREIATEANRIKQIFTKEVILMRLNHDMITYVTKPEADKEISSQYRGIITENLTTMYDTMCIHFDSANALKPFVIRYSGVDDGICYHLAEQFIQVGLASDKRTGYLIDHMNENAGKGKIMREHLAALKEEAEGMKAPKIKEKLLDQAKELEDKYSKRKKFAVKTGKN